MLVSLLTDNANPVVALEEGRVVYYRQSPVPLPSDDDLAFLRAPRVLTRKNISYYPDSDRVRGDSDERMHRILKTHSANVRAFLAKEIAPLVSGWRVGTSSFRPLQERGRALKAHASNELVHVDAGAYGATHGGGVLRFFVNLHPTEDRVWATKGTFGDVFRRYGARAGVTGLDLRERWYDRARTSTLNAAGALVPPVRMADSSPFDRAMRRLHNFMKDTPEFQADPVGHEEFRFPPLSAWMVMTDRLSHAVMSGQFAFVDTFIISPAAMTRPDLSPLRMMSA